MGVHLLNRKEAMMRRSFFLTATIVIAGFAYADGPTDNIVGKVRPVPPPGIKIAEADFAELKKGVIELGKEIDGLAQGAWRRSRRCWSCCPTCRFSITPSIMPCVMTNSMPRAK